eukprot:m.215665 g.215665  ORF g.215665 m.215665 type:complete len:118 (-) comp22206_c0_seq1:245-598(-)
MTVENLAFCQSRDCAQLIARVFEIKLKQAIAELPDPGADSKLAEPVKKHVIHNHTSLWQPIRQRTTPRATPSTTRRRLVQLVGAVWLVLTVQTVRKAQDPVPLRRRAWARPTMTVWR